MRGFQIILLTIAAASVVACTGSSDDVAVSGSSLTEAAPVLNPITSIALTCTHDAPFASLDLWPSRDGALEGSLGAADGSGEFDCTVADKTGRAPVTHCTERTERGSLPGRTIDVVANADGTTNATLTTYEGERLDLPCSAPSSARAVVPSYEEVAGILQNNCTRCHRPQAFGSLERIKENREMMLTKLEAGEMPRDRPNWFRTTDGKKVVEFLRNSPELQ